MRKDNKIDYYNFAFLFVPELNSNKFSTVLFCFGLKD